VSEVVRGVAATMHSIRSGSGTHGAFGIASC
jgi:hypothetical protein